MGTTLLRDWDLLQERVMPPLLEQAAPTTRIWSIGDPADAVAMAVAFAHASAGRDRSVTVFSSGRRGWDGVNFNTGDLRCLPPAERSSLFQRHDRHWVPNSIVSDHVRLGEPGGPVDLVTIGSAAGDASGDILVRVLDLLREGGRLLTSESGGAPAGMRPDGEGDRLFFMESTTTTAAPARTDDATSTLATWQAQERLVTEHLGLARSLARRFAHRGEAPDDLAAVAQLALVKASRRYEEDRGTPFAPYATACILGELKRHFRDRAWSLRVPRPLQELYLAAKEAREELGHELGRSPTVAQIAEHLSVSEEALLEAMEAGTNYRADSLDVPTTDDDRPTDVGMTDPAFERVIDRERLRILLPSLEHEERLVLKRLFFEEQTQQQVADELGVSQMQVSRMLARTAKKLRR